MKPLNLDNRPCSPISSNCVIWQGPDIPCIKLCTGDTVSDIVFKLATELCAIMDQLNVSNYDLSCLNLTACPPEDFQALIQLLIDKVCELNGVPTEEIRSSGCPDCVVSVAQCFIEGNQTTMQLVDYVQMIANKICAILDQLDIINNQITNLDNRVTVLENAPPPTFTLPSIDTGCLATYIIGNPASATIDIVLDTLLNNGVAGYCALIAATDLPANILSAVATQCITGTDNSLANPGDTFSSAYGPYTGFGTWNNTPFTAADAINNLWIAICDIYNYVKDLAITVENTNSINLTYNSGILLANIQDTGWKDLDGFAFYTGAMASNKPQCRRIGNQIHFRGNVFIPINNGAGAPVPLTTGNAYNNIYRVTPYLGAGGIIYDADSRILFNNTGGGAASVIPSSVLDAGTNLDGSYSVPQLLATRKLNVESTLGSGITGAVQLTAAVNVVLLPNKTLRVTPLSVFEQEPTDLISFAGSSLLNNLTSSFTPRSWLINLRNYTPSHDGNMSINSLPLVQIIDLTVGEFYMIKSYTIGDDFTNVGAAVNAVGQTFIATAAIPTTWTTSQLINIKSAVFNDGFNTLPTGSQLPPLLDLTTPNFDAARSNNLGGFVIKLDGLMAYVDPCTTDIKNYSCS